MPLVQVTILGGLPVFAEVWFSKGDGWMTDDDAGVDALYWVKRRKGRLPTKGAEVSQKIYDRLNKLDPYWEANVTEQANEALAAEYYDAQERKAEEARDERLIDSYFKLT